MTTTLRARSGGFRNDDFEESGQVSLRNAGDVQVSTIKTPPGWADGGVILGMPGAGYPASAANINPAGADEVRTALWFCQIWKRFDRMAFKVITNPGVTMSVGLYDPKTGDRLWWSKGIVPVGSSALNFVDVPPFELEPRPYTIAWVTTGLTNNYYGFPVQLPGSLVGNFWQEIYSPLAVNAECTFGSGLGGLLPPNLFSIGGGFAARSNSNSDIPIFLVYEK